MQFYYHMIAHIFCVKMDGFNVQGKAFNVITNKKNNKQYITWKWTASEKHVLTKGSLNWNDTPNSIICYYTGCWVKGGLFEPSCIPFLHKQMLVQHEYSWHFPFVIKRNAARWTHGHQWCLNCMGSQNSASNCNAELFIIRDIKPTMTILWWYCT